MNKEKHQFKVEIEAESSFAAGCVMQNMMDSAKLGGFTSRAAWIDADCEFPESQPSALSTQVGGTHYKDMAIQPMEYCQRNKLGACESSVIRYVSRHGKKNGAEDLRKAIHCLNLLLELEYPEEKK